MRTNPPGVNPSFGAGVQMPTRPRFFAAYRLLAISFLCLAGSLAAMAAPTNVWVDAAYTSSGANDGHTWQTDAFDKLQDAIDAVAEGGTVNIHAGTYKGAKTTKSVNIKADKDAIIHGASPALTISTTTSITGGTWLPSPSGGNDPTILIQAGGNLTLRGATIVESTGFAQSCIQIDAGTLNAGTTVDPGTNTFQISGVGRFITNNTATAVSAIGNTWKQDATTYSLASLADNFAIEDRVYHSVDDGSKGFVTWIANNNVYVTANSGSVQRGINAAGSSWIVNINSGTYAENLIINKSSLEIAGVGQASVTVVPGTSSPLSTGGDCDEYGGGGGSIVMLVRADNVVIHDLTIDGNNPSISSGVVRGGSDIDARDGILTDFGTGTFNNLNVHDVSVKNVYLRGIENKFGTGISFVNNTVQNVWGSTDCSIGIFNRSGSGLIAYNSVSGTPDAISANHSLGTQFLTNTITASASGVHSDNNGDAGGVADSIAGNVVLDGAPDGSGNSYGIWLLAPYRSVSIQGNLVSNVLFGVTVFGQGAAVTPAITGNSILGLQAANGIGIKITTGLFGFGSVNVMATLSANVVSNHVTGVQLEQEPGYSAAATVSGNTIVMNGVGVNANGGNALLQNNNMTGNTAAGVRVQNGATVDAGQCGAGSNVTGLGISTGGNNLTGYGFDNAAPWAVEDLNTSVQPGVLAFNNNYGTQANVKDLVKDGVDNAGASSLVGYSQSGALYVTCPANTSVQCLGGVPTADTTLAAFLADGGVASSTAASVSPADGPLTPGPQEGTITRTYTVTDTCGNSSFCQQTITVDDTVPPLVSCQNITVNLDASGNVSITPAQVVASASDACGGTLNYSVSPSSFTCANYGPNNVTLTVDDNRGNTNTCVAQVTVNDITAPVIACGTITVQLDSAGNYTLSAADRNGLVTSVTEACGVLSTNISRTTFNYCDYPSTTVNVTVTDIHNNTSTPCVATINFLAPPTPTVVYVDGNYPATCAGVSFPSNGVPGPYYAGFNAFKTIQAGINAVASGGTVNVAAGTYVEDVTVTKSLSLLGPNANINPNTGSRVPEAVIIPYTSDGDVITGAEVVVYVEASNVQIKGFTVDGDNPGLTSGINLRGADIDAAEAISSYEGVGSITISNNIVKNISYSGLDFYNYFNGAAATSGNRINDNKFQNIGLSPYGTAILIYNNFYAEIADNVMTDVRGGVQTGNFYQSNPGTTSSITGNNIASTRLGIFHNLHYSSASSFIISGNTFSPVSDAGETRWVGIFLSSLQSSVTATIQNNIMNGAVVAQPTTSGYDVWSCTTTAGITISGGAVSNCKYGAWVNNYDSYNSTGGASTMTLQAITITGSTGAGVYVKDNPLSTHAAVRAVLTSGCSISGGNVGVLVDAGAASADPGDTAISSVSGNYITLANASTANMDATAVTFDGNIGSGMTLSQLYATEDKIQHKVDDATLGFVRVKAANVYVTLASGSIQRGVDAASVNDTVNVNSGTFTENVLLNKAVSLIGSGSGAGGTTLATASGDPSTGLIQVSASGALANPVLVKDMQITPAGRSGLSVGRFTLSDGVSVDYLTLNNVRVIGDNLNPCTEQERGLYVDNTSSLTHLTVINCAFDNLHYGWYLHKAVSADTSTVRYVQVTGTTFNHNNNKGIYAEKLSDASFSCCVIGTNGYDSSLLSGCSFFIPNLAGFDINLKAGTYANLSFENSDFLRNALGVGAVNGIGLAVKGRGTGSDPSYVSFPGLVSGVSVSYCRFDNNQRGVRFGEPGKGNTTPTSISVLDSSFTADASAIGLDNQLNLSAPAVNAVSNWWGSVTGPSNPSNAGGTGEAVTGSGLVTFNPWLGDSTDTLASCGFQPNPAPVYYLPHHLFFATQPGGAGINSPLSPQPVVQVIDSNGGVDTVFNGTVTLSIANNPSSGTLAGTTTLNVINGVASYTGLSIDHAGAGYTLLATSQSPVISATSDPFDISNSAPTISTLVPSFAVAGDPGFTLTVNGANFVYNSVVRWAGSVRPTTYVSPSQVTASISMTDIASTGFFNITVSNAAPGGGESAPASFEVKPVPTVVYVDDDFNSGNTGGHIWNYDAFNTVQGGINRVAAGGTVYVATGSYSENVTANKAVTLFGANQGVDGCGSRGPESTISGGAGVAVNITSDNVTVDGFALTGATCVRDISKVGVAVRNNVITAGAVGLDVEQILTTALATVTVERNCVSLTTQVAGSTPTIGLLLAGAAGPQAVIIRTNGVSGAFYGYLLYSANAGVPTAIRGGTVSGVMQGVAVINLDPVTFTVYSPSTFIVDGLSMSGFSGNYPANPNNNLHAGIYVFTGGSSTANKISGSISNVTIVGTGKISPDSSGMDFADFSTASGVMQQIDVSNCSVNTNHNRGIFASGANAAITVTRSSILANGFDPYVTGGNHGFGVIARNKASVNVSESFIENPLSADQTADTVYAVECDANTPALGPTLTVFDCSIDDHGNGLSAKQSDGTLNASGNWWASSVALTIAGKLNGVIDYTPYLDSGTDTNLVAPGFQGDLHTLHVVAASPQTGSTSRIQEGIDMTAGSTVIIEAGNYAENILANKDNIELAGVGQALVTIVPAVSAPNPCAGSSLCGGAASSIILVQANNVKIHDVTLDGDNPSLSGVNVGGANIDARNGIIEDFTFGPGIFNGTEVYNTTVRNVFLRAIYASSGGSGFSFHNNTVQNVQGEANSVGIFNFGGSGLIAYNNVQNCGDAIAANHSRGTQFMTNSVSNSGSGVHTDNAGDGGGSADLLQGNIVTTGTPAAYGVWVFAPYIAPTANANTISSCGVGLASAGQGAAVTPVFSNNSVGAGQPGSIGAYETTSLFGFGSSAVSTLFQNNNVQGTVYGFYLEGETGFALAAGIESNDGRNNQYGVYVTGALAKAKVQNNDLRNNSIAALHAINSATIDAGNCTATDVTGLGQSTGGNNLSGYGFDNASPFAAENLNGGGSPAIYAYQDIYGALAGDNLARLFSGNVLASQSGGLLLTCPGPVNIQCLASVPAPATDLAGFIAQGGTASATVASVSNYDSVVPSSPNDRVITRQYTLTDPCGQVAACNQIITVDDTIPPMVSTWPSPPAPVTVNGVCQAAVPDLRPQVVATDNCGALHTNQSPSAGTLVGPGTYTVYVSVSDDGGNSVTNPGTISFVVNAGSAPSDVYVDDGYVGLPTGTSVDWPYTGNTGPHYIGCDAFATIQGGYARVAAAGTVNVAAGNYAENISVTKRVSILGAKSGVDARGRVTGAPNPAVESIVTSAALNTSIFDLNTGCALSIIDGFVFSGGGGGGTVGAIRSSSNPIDQVQIINNHFASFLDAAIWFNRGGTDVTVAQNVMDGSGMTAGAQIIFLNGPQTFAGLWLNSNWILNGGSRAGLFVDGTRNVNPSGSRAPQIVGNLFANNDVGINMGSRSFDSGVIAFNTFTNSTFDGLQGGPKDSLIVSNVFAKNGRWGLALTSFGNTSAGRGATNDLILCNRFTQNGIGGPATGNGGLLLSASQFAGNNGSHHINFNNFSGNSTGLVYTATETIDAKTNWWGSANGPTIASNPGGTGDQIVGTTVAYNPYLSSDNSFPFIACPNNIVTVTDPGQCTAVVTFAPSAVSTCCSGPIPTASIPPSGFAFPVGTTTVTSWATNACGNVSSCSFTVTVNDNQPPTISSTSATENQPYIVGPVNVKNCAASTVQGVVNISVVASDQCPLSPPTINLTNGAAFAAATFVNQSPPGTYNYTWTVGPSTANGTWTATVAASDTANTTISTFTLCVDKSQITGALTLQGFIGSGTVPPHTRTVTFVATDGPGGGANVLKTWTLALSNVSGDTFSYTLTGVPAGTLGLSAKTDWHLRRKLSVALDVNGQAVENFTGLASQLNGGDISASNPALRDNQVQLFDYLRLLNDWHTLTSVADIDGNGQVSTGDYNILSANWFTSGDPQ